MIRILQDEVYIGRVVQGKKHKVSYKVNKYVDVPVAEWTRVDNMHKAIISKTDFDSVQILMERNTLKCPNENVSHMYAGMLFCGECGNTMVRRIRKSKEGKTIFYYCTMYNHHGKCSGHNIREDELNTIVLSELKKIISEMCDFKELSNNLNKLSVGYENAVQYDKEVVTLQKELQKYTTLKSSLYQDLKEGVINQAQFNSYREKYSNREIEITAAIKKQKELIKEIYDNGIAAGVKLEQFKKNLTVDEIDRITLVTFIDRILIYADNRIDIIFKFRNEINKLKNIQETASKLSNLEAV